MISGFIEKVQNDVIFIGGNYQDVYNDVKQTIEQVNRNERATLTFRVQKAGLCVIRLFASLAMLNNIFYIAKAIPSFSSQPETALLKVAFGVVCYMFWHDSFIRATNRMQMLDPRELKGAGLSGWFGAISGNINQGTFFGPLLDRFDAFVAQKAAEYQAKKA